MMKVKNNWMWMVAAVVARQRQQRKEVDRRIKMQAREISLSQNKKPRKIKLLLFKITKR